ncbi:hypothetical protein OAE48_01935 [Flavobacteriales bacterium]|nr:hypothetical protein [Flavobacteriales bacterium]
MKTLSARQLLFVDGIGAIISAIMLGMVFPHFQQYVGMPITELYLLASLPIAFAVFDLYWLSFRAGNERTGLMLIAFSNMAYSLLSMLLVVVNFELLTALGLSYFIIELLVLAALVAFELKIAEIK